MNDIRPIDANAIIDQINNENWNCATGYQAYSDIFDIIDTAPTLDYVPAKRGHWIKAESYSEGCGMGESYGYYFRCSECNHKVKGGYSDCGVNYCSNCGSDNRGEQNDKW